MAKGILVLIGALLVFNLALGAIAFALKHNRFPSGLEELFRWLF